MAKTEALLEMERVVGYLKSKQDVSSNVQKLSRLIKMKFNISFDINIVNNKNNDFFGMSIYPTRSKIDMIIDQIVNKKSHTDIIQDIWLKGNEWILEIDSMLLYDTNLNANPAEIVSVLLHEIGHVVYSNTIPARINKIIRYEMLHASYSLKKLLQWSKAHKLLMLPFIEACNIKNFHSVIARQKELGADKFAVDQGYSEDLNQFIDKLLKSQGNGLVDRTEKELEKDVKSLVTWTLINISELEFRKSKLRTTLQTEVLKNPSTYIRTIIYDIKNTFFGGSDGDSYKEIVTEQYLVGEHRRIVKESFLSFFDKMGKLKKVNQNEIDIISVEKERIENLDDKIYVLDLIYDKLDLLERGFELISDGASNKVPMSKDRMKHFKEQLEILRKETMAVTVNKKAYGLFVKYPDGYEG